MSNQEVEWYKTWFNSPYYHILYQNRNYTEAELFITYLLSYLKCKHGAKCLDLCCGNGRHAIFLNKKGMDVTGVDLSIENIKKAQAFENETLRFFIHDMREVFKKNKYDFIFNIFTSFGYFDSYSENVKVINAVYQMLNENGTFIIDFMNIHYALKNLVENEVKEWGGITFHLHKKYDGQHIIKEIQFNDKGKNFHFVERVQAINYCKFEELLENANFEIVDCFGDYQLSSFDEQKSDRLILIAKKR